MLKNVVYVFYVVFVTTTLYVVVMLRQERGVTTTLYVVVMFQARKGSYYYLYVVVVVLRQESRRIRIAVVLWLSDTHFFKQPHFQIKPRVAIKIPKMRLKVAMKLPSIFGIEARGC